MHEHPHFVDEMTDADLEYIFMDPHRHHHRHPHDYSSLAESPAPCLCTTKKKWFDIETGEAHNYDVTVQPPLLEVVNSDEDDDEDDSAEEDPSQTKTKKATEEVSSSLVKDMYQMTLEERQAVLHDVHGVPDLTEETQDKIRQQSQQLEQQLLMTMHRHVALQMAWNQSSRYVRSLYLQFLRCFEFDISECVERMVKYFEFKLELFGVHALGRDVLLSDFNTQDLECLQTGYLQLLPVRDAAGRAIIFQTDYVLQFHCRENALRTRWYLEQMALQDEETQKRGVIYIIYNVTEDWKKTFEQHHVNGIARLRKCTPVRGVGIHMCYSDPTFGLIVDVCSRLFDRHCRSRWKMHEGSHVETQYELLSFGIPFKPLPVDSDGVLSTKALLASLRAWQAQEQKTSSGQTTMDRIIIPTHNDVLFGRGKNIQSHMGNLKMGHLIEQHVEDYIQCQKLNGKRELARNVFDKIQQADGRFLKQDGNGVWERVADTVAVDKVGHGFRNRKILLQQQQRQGSSGEEKSSSTKKKHVELLQTVEKLGNTSVERESIHKRSKCSGSHSESHRQ